MQQLVAGTAAYRVLFQTPRVSAPLLRSSVRAYAASPAFVPQNRPRFAPDNKGANGQVATAPSPAAGPRPAYPTSASVSSFLAASSAPVNPYAGVSDQRFDEATTQVLLESIDKETVEIKPDGIIYWPEIHYRRRLNRAFGPGGWAMLPLDASVLDRNTLSREFGLYVGGRFIAQARGEQAVVPNSPMTLPTTEEAAKSNALMRCCKDIGIASELWDPVFIARWKAELSVAVWCEHIKSKEKKRMWRRADREPFAYPWRETAGDGGGYDSAPSSSSSAPSSSSSSPYTSSGSASAAAAASDEPFSLDQQVPSSWRKVAGHSFAEVLETRNGQDYLVWLYNNARGPGQAKALVARALQEAGLSHLIQQ